MDKKEMDMRVATIANRGGSHNKSPSPASNFGQRMAAARKTARVQGGTAGRVSSNAPPSPTQANKTKGKPVQVQVPATKVPEVKKGKKGPTMQTGAGKKGGHTFTFNIS